MNPPLKITARKGHIFDNKLEFFLHGRTENGGVIIAKPVDFIHIFDANDPNWGYESNPTFSLEPSTCQSLMDALWHHGVRPTDGHGSTGQLAAVESHLAHTSALLAQVLPTVLNQANAHTLGYLPPTVRLPTAPASGS